MAKRGRVFYRRIRFIGQLLLSALVLFTGGSMLASVVGKPSGMIGDFLAKTIFAIFGGPGLLVPIFAGVAVGLWIARFGRWRRFWGCVLLAGGVFLWSAVLSFYAQVGNPVVIDISLPFPGQGNFAGFLGAVFAGFCIPVFGLGILAVVVLLFYWGFVLWFRKGRVNDLTTSLIILWYGVILQFWSAYLGLPSTVAGVWGYLVVNFLFRLLGGFGTVLVLIVLLAGTVSFTGLGVYDINQLLRGFVSFCLRWIRPRKAGLSPSASPTIQVEAPSSLNIDAPPVKPSPPVQEPVEPEPVATVERIKISSSLRSAVRFDHLRFQQEFLERLDQPGPQDRVFKDPKEAEAEGELLIRKLREFGVDGRLTAILSGPMITRFELEPAPGVRCSGIESLADDIALALSAERVRILAPIPGKSAVGVEIPNKSRRTVYLREVLTSEVFQQLDSPLGFALGTTITGEPYCADLRAMPHILIAGTTGSGKSVCINSIIMSIIYRATPDEVRFLTIDPKQLELPIYNPIPHLLSRTTVDPEKVVDELTRIVAIMEARYSEFAELGVRDISSFNARCEEAGKKRKPYIVVVIDELADLMQRAPSEIEARIIRLAQMSRAVGIHLILATQRPSVDVITGLIKANFPCRIAFQVATKVDSRTILDANGAESLLGRGDMLFLPPGKGEPVRLHGCFVSELAAKRVVELWAIRYLSGVLSELTDEPVAKAKALVEADLVDVFYDPRHSVRGKKLELIQELLGAEVVDSLLKRRYYEPLEEEIDASGVRRAGADEGNEDYDPLFEQAARLVVMHREASVSMLQRRLDVGWARAGRIIDQLERAGVVGPHAGSKPRKVLLNDEAELKQRLNEIFNRQDG